MPRFDITTLGESQLRLSVPPGTRLEEARQFNLHIAGTEANITALLSRLGWRCGWFSALPDTPLGRRVLNEYRMAGLDLSAVTWVPQARLATYYVEFAVPPRPTQVIFDRADSAFANLTPAQVDWDYLLDSRLVHFSGITTALNADLQAVVQRAITQAKERGLTVSFDVNFRENLWSSEQAARTLRPLLQDVDILFCGLSDARRVFGIQGSPQEIVAQLGELTPAQHIVTSLSAEGLIGWDRQRFYQQPARRVQILDRIGAGDAMIAGVLHGWLQGDFSKGLRYGALTAALALSQYGDLVLTNREELENLLDSGDVEIKR